MLSKYSIFYKFILEFTENPFKRYNNYVVYYGPYVESNRHHLNKILFHPSSFVWRWWQMTENAIDNSLFVTQEKLQLSDSFINACANRNTHFCRCVVVCVYVQVCRCCNVCLEFSVFHRVWSCLGLCVIF